MFPNISNKFLIISNMFPILLPFRGIRPTDRFLRPPAFPWTWTACVAAWRRVILLSSAWSWRSASSSHGRATAPRLTPTTRRVLRMGYMPCCWWDTMIDKAIFIVRKFLGNILGRSRLWILGVLGEIGWTCVFPAMLACWGATLYKIWQYRETRGIHPQSWGSALISCRYRFYLNLCQPSSNLNFTSPSLTKDTCPTTTSPVRSSTLGASMPSKASLRSAGGTANVVHVVLFVPENHIW